MGHYKYVTGKLRSKELMNEMFLETCKMLEYWELDYHFLIHQSWKDFGYSDDSVDKSPGEALSIFSDLTIYFCPEDGDWMNPFTFAFDENTLEIFELSFSSDTHTYISYQIFSHGGTSVREKVEVFASLFSFLSKWFDIEIEDSHENSEEDNVDCPRIDFSNMNDEYKQQMRKQYFALRNKYSDDYGYMLQEYVGSGNTAGIQTLLDQGADINTEFETQTPLCLAASDGNIEMVEYLINAGADVNKANVKGVTPLMFATISKHGEVASLLIDKNADINAMDWFKNTALYFAVNKNDVSTARLLLERGADINARNAYGSPLIYEAIQMRSVQMASLLIENGASINDTGINDSFSPLLYAKMRKCDDIEELLNNNGAWIYVRSLEISPGGK